LRKASKLGLRTSFLPAEYGGGGLDILSRVIMLDELGQGDSAFGYMIFLGSGGMEKFVRYCSQEVIDEYIGQIVEDDTFLFANATTEPNHGTDVHLPYDAPGGGMETYAERRGDEWVINGVKDWISNGGVAKMYIVNARTDRKGPLSQSMSQFLVPPDTPGFSIGKIHDKMGSRLEMNAELIFEDARIPARYLMGEENKAWAAREQVLNIVVNYKNALLVGVLQAIYDEALNYAKTRIQGGKPIIEHPTIGVMLAEMRGKIEAARLLVYQFAWSVDQGEYDPKMGWVIKGFVGGIAPQITASALEIFGGMGQERGMLIEKLLRDVCSQLHGVGLRTSALLKGRPTL